jgi:hypothetical protein
MASSRQPARDGMPRLYFGYLVENSRSLTETVTPTAQTPSGYVRIVWPMGKVP